MKELLKMIKEASETTDKLEKILFDMKCYSEWEGEMGSEELIKEAFIKAINPDEWNINNESDKTYENEPEKRKDYFLGVKSGYYSAFFWLADYMGLLEFFENEISPILRCKDER